MAKFSDETRKKLSDNAKRLWADPEFRAKASKAISEAKKGKHVGKDNPMYGKKHSEETMKKIGQKQSDSWLREETREKKIKALKERTPTFLGQSHTEETKALISQKAKARWQDPEFRKFLIATRKPLFKRAAWKQKQAEARKKLWMIPQYGEKALGGLSNKPMTSLEQIVADVLNFLDVKYETQKVIGRAIVDFYIPEKNLIVEADGRYWHDKPEVAERDRKRDFRLRSKGYKVVRIGEESLKSDALRAVRSCLTET